MKAEQKPKRGVKPGTKRGHYKTNKAEIMVKDMFATGEKERNEISLLMFEWAVKFWDISPRQYLITKKGYSDSGADHVIARSGGGEEWAKERANCLDKMTESVVKRHIDKLAEVNDQHIRASQLVMAKAIEYLTKMKLEPAVDRKGKLIMVDGKPVYKGMRSIDIMNIASAIKTGQDIYRRAMGLPNDEGGLAQILEKVNQLNLQQNLTINMGTGETEAAPDPKALMLKKAEDTLEYDDIIEFVRFRREEKRKLKDVTPKPQEKSETKPQTPTNNVKPEKPK